MVAADLPPVWFLLICLRCRTTCLSFASVVLACACRCTSAPGAGLITRVRVVVAGQSVVLASGVSLSYRTPTVSGVSPALLNTQGGDTVRLPLPAVFACCEFVPRIRHCFAWRFSLNADRFLLVADVYLGHGARHSGNQCVRDLCARRWSHAHGHLVLRVLVHSHHVSCHSWLLPACLCLPAVSFN